MEPSSTSMLSGIAVLNKSGDLVEFVGTAMDITERKQREEALLRSEGYLAEAQKLTHTGSWAVRVPQMENAQGEAGQAIAAIPKLGWPLPIGQKRCTGFSASILIRRHHLTWN